jgi:hypothetical protein
MGSVGVHKINALPEHILELADEILTHSVLAAEEPLRVWVPSIQPRGAYIM